MQSQVEMPAGSSCSTFEIQQGQLYQSRGLLQRDITLLVHTEENEAEWTRVQS